MIRKVIVRMNVNGRLYERLVEPRTLLSDFLRHEINKTGTHVGCEHGVCGACTVLIDGESVRSCLTLAVQAEGAEITTVEGIGDIDDLNLLQRKFREHHALQCGFCTSGMLMTATDILSRRERLTDKELREALSGNICRCTGYEHIVRAVSEALEETLGSAT